jgi:hypothetical protein
MGLVLAGVASGGVENGQVDLEILGGLSMESTSEGSNQDDILAGAAGADLDAWFVTGGISWFRTKNLQLGITGLYSSMSGSDTACLDIDAEIPGAIRRYDVDVDLTMYGAGGRAKWHFNPDDPMVFFLGLQASWVTADVDVTGEAAILVDDVVFPGSEVEIDESNSDSGILWGPILGLRWQLGENDDLLFEYQYRLWAGSIGDILDSGHAIAIGLSHRLK